MNTTMWALISGAIFTVLVALGGFKAGESTSALECSAERARATDKIITRQEVIIKEVPKVITKYVQTTTTVENTYHDAQVLVPDLFDPNCVMPRWWGELFTNAANGIADDPRRAGQAARPYGCLETAKATLSDLSAGARNSAQLDGIQQWARIVTKGEGK